MVSVTIPRQFVPVRDEPEGSRTAPAVPGVAPSPAETATSLDGVRLLVVEDDQRLADMLRRAMQRLGYAVDVAATGQNALWYALENDYDAVILDVMIPAPDGFTVVRRLREAGRWAPVLMLTARDRVEDRVTGLDAGADDYLAKPFAMSELTARVRALTRRVPRERPPVLRVGDLVLDPARHAVWRADAAVNLSPTEFALLGELMAAPGQVLSRADLIDRVWDFGYDGTSNVVDVYISRLRDKVDRPFGRHSIESVRGVGYRLSADG